MKNLHKKQELIATFMGIRKDEEFDAWLYHINKPFIKSGYYGWADMRHVRIKAKSGQKASRPHYILSVGHLRYNREWNWLIPVLERLEFVHGMKLGIDSFRTTGIKEAFNLTVKLIKQLQK